MEIPIGPLGGTSSAQEAWRDRPERTQQTGAIVPELRRPIGALGHNSDVGGFAVRDRIGSARGLYAVYFAFLSCVF